MRRLQNNFIQREATANDSVLKLLGPSLLGIIVCMICLAGASWAWFTAGVQSQSTIKASSYTLGETVREKASGSSQASAEDVMEKSANGTYHLEADKEYTVTLKPEETPISGGYCIVKLTYKDANQDHTVKYYTKSLKAGVSFSFTISNGEKPATCQLLAAWGNSENLDISDSDRCSSGDVIKVNGGVSAASSDEASADTTEGKSPQPKSTDTSSKDTSSSDKKNLDVTEGQKKDNSDADSKVPSTDDGSGSKTTDGEKTDSKSETASAVS